LAGFQLVNQVAVLQRQKAELGGFRLVRFGQRKSGKDLSLFAMIFRTGHD
jgi:hypothetical protein